MPAFGLATVVIDGSDALAVTLGGAVHPLSALVEDGPRTFEEVMVDWDHWVTTIEARLDSPWRASWIASDAVAFRPPGVARPAVWCAAANYSDYLDEIGATFRDQRVYHFLSPPTVLGAHRGTVRRPSGATKLDWEIELAAVIGRTARHVAAEDALSHVIGYTIANDVSVRDANATRHDFFGVDWTSAKNGDGLTPVGPAIVPARFVPDPGDLELRLTVNGGIRQRSSTSRMIVSLAEQIAALSELVTLRPGDLILTGTPAGTGAAHGAYLAEGDVMVATIAHLGSLRSTVV